jgi:hypothetical protein
MSPDIDDLYAVLAKWASARTIDTYAGLSKAYEARTGEWFEPHGSWDQPLGELNRRLAEAGAPALTALVVLQKTGEPGRNFWGCASNVPSQPADDASRSAIWGRIVEEVFARHWSRHLP